jgi:hypothetical protein
MGKLWLRKIFKTVNACRGCSCLDYLENKE